MAEVAKMRTTQSDSGTIWQVRTYPSASSSSVIASSTTYSPCSYRPDSQKLLQVPQTPSRQSSGILMRERYEASATVSPSRHVMKRVTPSSNVSAI
jgi:hypothetical protein